MAGKMKLNNVLLYVVQSTKYYSLCSCIVVIWLLKDELDTILISPDILEIRFPSGLICSVELFT